MYEKSFDGTQRPIDLLSRINSEDRVGDSLSEETIIIYERKIRQIARRLAIADLNELTPEQIVRDLFDRIDSEQIARATARIEKSAALFWIAQQAQRLLDSDSPELQRYETAYRDIHSAGTSNLPRTSENTSSPKLKEFSDEAVEILEKAVLTDRSTPLMRALMFVRANLPVGLRPIEWFSTTEMSYLHRDGFEEYQRNNEGRIQSSLALEVQNAKHSSVRGNGESRTILLESMNDRQKRDIRKWLQTVDNIKSSNPDISTGPEIHIKIFEPMRKAIKRAFLKFGWKGEIPSIYSTRHQAVANAKADKKTRREIAALFGHSSTDTARKHYGKKRKGYSGRSMDAAPESIIAVRSAATVRPEKDLTTENENVDSNRPMKN